MFRSQRWRMRWRRSLFLHVGLASLTNIPAQQLLAPTCPEDRVQTSSIKKILIIINIFVQD